MNSSELTKGIGLLGAILMRINGGAAVTPFAGAPTSGGSGTFHGTVLATPGSLLIDTTNKNVYQNTNTKASPTWSKLSTAGSLSPTLAQDAVTAGSTQTQAGATQLTGGVVTVATVTTLGDGVKLPVAAAGLEIAVANAGANPMKVYGSGSDTINGIAGATGVMQGANTIAFYTCTLAGAWRVAQGELEGFIPIVLANSGAINPHAAQTYVITKAGIAAMTLAAPTAGIDDGVTITITSDTANAHTVTCPSSVLKNGGAAVTAFTFTGTTSGGGLTLLAYNGTWKVMASVGGAFA